MPSRDLRDPTELGNKLLYAAQHRRAHGDKTKPLSYVADHAPLGVPDYANSQGPIEKYGDPTKIPSTMPNSAE